MTMSSLLSSLPARSAHAGTRWHWRRSALLGALAGRARDRMFASGKGDGPPDLDELWRDFNNKLGGLFGGRKPARPGNGRVAMAAAAQLPARHEERRHRRRARRAASWC